MLAKKMNLLYFSKSLWCMCSYPKQYGLQDPLPQLSLLYLHPRTQFPSIHPVPPQAQAVLAALKMNREMAWWKILQPKLQRTRRSDSSLKTDEGTQFCRDLAFSWQRILVSAQMRDQCTWLKLQCQRLRWQCCDCVPYKTASPKMNCTHHALTDFGMLFGHFQRCMLVKASM